MVITTQSSEKKEFLFIFINYSIYKYEIDFLFRLEKYF